MRAGESRCMMDDERETQRKRVKVSLHVVGGLVDRMSELRNRLGLAELVEVRGIDSRRGGGRGL